MLGGGGRGEDGGGQDLGQEDVGGEKVQKHRQEVDLRKNSPTDHRQKCSAERVSRGNIEDKKEEQGRRTRALIRLEKDGRQEQSRCKTNQCAYPYHSVLKRKFNTFYF